MGATRCATPRAWCSTRVKRLGASPLPRNLIKVPPSVRRHKCDEDRPGGIANESGGDENLCFFIKRIGEEGFPGREQADGVMDTIVKPAASKLRMESVRADQPADPGQITTNDQSVWKRVLARRTRDEASREWEQASPGARP